MQKTFWGSMLAVLGMYSVFGWLMSMNWETYSFLPLLIIIGCLSMFFVLGSVLYNKYDLGGVLMGIFIPHMIADTCYILGLNMNSQVLNEWFQKIVPHVYGGLKLTNIFFKNTLTETTQIILLTVCIIPLCYGSFLLGMKLRKSANQVGKWFYNNVFTWGVHFVLFVVFTNVATKFISILVDPKIKLYFAVGATCTLFLVYFFVGKWCHTMKNSILQITSMAAISLTATVLYVGYLFAVLDAGIFERYMLPVATSFLGIICQRLGIMTGARAVVISQYGLLATILMIAIPTLLLVVGKYASLPEKHNKKKGLFL